MLSVARVDEQLFRPGSWRALGAGNQVVAGVRPGSLHAALALCGQGQVATFYGRLRPGVVVVDVDLAESAEVVMAISAWCAEHGLWHLVRASGRRGHQHVFIVVGDRRAQLEELAAGLRTNLRIGRNAVDVRQTVRPLCAPHRFGGMPPPPRRLDLLARRLPAVLRALPCPESDRGRGRPGVPAGVSPAVPVPVARRELPPAWARYLAEGVLPRQVAAWADRSRSAVEATATFHMVAAGWTGQRAWSAVATAHPQAMAKARSRGQQWWVRHVWNRAVADHAAELRNRPPREPGERRAGSDPQVAERVRQLQEAFLGVWGNYGRDRRHTLRFVLDTIAERMIRTGAATVPCPERDLVLDTGITSRKVLRTCLHQLHDDGWLVLDTSFDPTSTDPSRRSHHVRLPDQVPHRGHQGSGAALRSPPSSSTPLPGPVRPSLGPELWHTLTALPPDRAAPLAELLAHRGTGAGTRRTLLTRLNRLAELGMASCDATGCWQAAGAAPAEVRAAAEGSQRQRSAAVAGERAQYALVQAGKGRWARLRQEAIQRARAARYQGARTWWEGLTSAEREARHREYSARYAALSLREQIRLKDELADRRRQAGVASEEAVRRAWLDSLSPQEYSERVLERTITYRAAPAPLRVARAAAWEDHRRRWGIQRDTFAPLPRQPRGDVMEPSGKAAGAVGAQQEELALGDALERDRGWALAGVSVGDSRGRQAGGAGG